MKEIMEALCRTWKAEWQGLVMAELRYERGEEGVASYEVTVSERRLVKVAAVCKETGEQMMMTLLPLRNSMSRGETETAEGTLWRKFSAEEVRDFSANLGDHNEIHQGARPIVSGFQILAALAERFPWRGIIIRFQQPLYAGEDVYLSETDGKVRGFSGGLCFTCEEIK